MIPFPGNLSLTLVSNLPSKLPRPEGTGRQRRNSMFNNLIESSSHAKEFKRRGSFLLFTTATYVILFVVTGVISIYAYDAHLEEQTLEITLISPQDFAPQPDPAPASQPNRPRETSNNTNAIAERATPMLSVNHP